MMILPIGEYSNQATAQETLDAKSTASAANNSPTLDEKETENLPKGDTVSLSVQAKELLEGQQKHVSAAEAKKAAAADVLQQFTTKLEESRLDASEVILGVMQQYLEESLESAERQSQELKEETERLAEQAKMDAANSQSSSEPEEIVSTYAGGTAEPTQEKKGEASTAGYTSAATGKTTAKSHTNLSLNV